MTADPWHSSILLAVRILLSLVFLFSGIEKSTNFQRTKEEFNRENIPLRPASAIFTIVLHLVAPTCLILGWLVTEMAIALAVFTLTATLMVHHFWTMQGDERLARTRVTLANLGLIGGLLLLAITGPGAFVL